MSKVNKLRSFIQCQVDRYHNGDGPNNYPGLHGLLYEAMQYAAAAQKEADLAAATKALLQHRDVEGFENLPNDLKCLLNRIANTTLKAIEQAEIGDSEE